MQNQKLVLPANVQKSVGLPTPVFGKPLNGCTVEEYIGLIKLWAQDRNLIEGSTFAKQSSKLISEYAELAKHLDKNVSENAHLISDDVGDMIVVLTILCAQVGMDIEPLIPDSVHRKSETSLDVDGLLAIIGLGVSSVAICQLEEDVAKGMQGMTHVITGLMESFSAMAQLFDSDFLSSLEQAYNDIKDRKGRMIDGKFVKEADLSGNE